MAIMRFEPLQTPEFVLYCPRILTAARSLASRMLARVVFRMLTRVVFLLTIGVSMVPGVFVIVYLPSLSLPSSSGRIRLMAL